METPETLAERLGNVSHFLKLPFSDRLAIIRTGQMRLFSPDTIIFSEQESCAGMFVLLRGHVHICKLGLKGQQNIIADIDPVIMFAERTKMTFRKCPRGAKKLLAFSKQFKQATQPKHDGTVCNQLQKRSPADNIMGAVPQV
jgi:hypothetical protein